MRKLQHDSRIIVELAADIKVFLNTKRSKTISKPLSLKFVNWMMQVKVLERTGTELLQSRR